MRITFLFGLFFLTSTTWSTFSQVKNGAIFHIAGGSKIQGELQSNDSVYKVKLLDESIYSVKKNSIIRAYFPDEITLNSNGKYNIDKGISLYISSGLMANHTSFDVSAGYQLGNGFELGVSFGYHNNSFNIPVPNNNFSFFNIDSYPLAFFGRYYPLHKTLLKPYATLKIGINNNSSTWEVTQIKTGPIIETGLGLVFSSRKRSRFFTEIVQYNTKANGTATTWEWNGTNNTQTNTVNFNLWINRIIFKIGISIELKG